MERGDTHHLPGVVLGCRVRGFIAATFFAAMGGLGLYAFGDSLSNYYLIPLYLGAITLPMLAIGEIQEGLARGFSWADLDLWPTYIIRPLLILAFIAGAVKLHWPASTGTAMPATTAAT